MNQEQSATADHGPTVALDPATVAVLDAMGDAPYLDLDAMPAVEALRVARQHLKPAAPPPRSEDVTVRGDAGAEIRIRLYYPEVRTTKLPLLMHLHGGGFVSGAIESDDARCAMLAQEANCIVASTGYRLAPEHRFPVAAEDAYLAWSWLTTHAATIGGDAARCAISGSSAGGHVAISAMLLMRERGTPLPIFQLLTYPVVDPRCESPSYSEFADGPFLTRARMVWYWQQYLGDGPDSAVAPLLQPMEADLTGFPPALVLTAEYDVLRDEGEAYVAHLRSAGIPAEGIRYPGMVHGFVSVLPQHPATTAALAASAAALTAAYSA